jgi:putative ubiquitin-RnfH superfamily antitoxin RatB of RatAB toxin-antitoxin module
MRVEVVYALPEGEDAAVLTLSVGATAGDAVAASGLAGRHPEIDFERCKLGIYGKVASPGHRLAEGDRVEVYRPLALDPKEARRRRAGRARRTRSPAT